MGIREERPLTTFLHATAGSLLLFAALPPLSIGPLGWVATIPWLLLIRRPYLAGRRPYLQLYAAGFLFWFLSLHWLRLPHPATAAGWVAVACYLGLYPPALVAIGRAAVHTTKTPLWLAAPVIWVGLELVRAHLLTGFLMASLAHTQIRWPAVLQIADLGGEYAVDFVMVLVAACLAEVFVRVRQFRLGAEARGNGGEGERGVLGWHALSPRRAWWVFNPLIPVVIAFAATLAYGQWRLSQNIQTPGPRVALIQGNALAEWKADPARRARIMDEYTRLSAEAVEAARTGGDGRPADLVVWPETMFRGTIVKFEQGYEPPADWPDFRTSDHEASGPAEIGRLVSRLNTPVLLGVDAVEFLAQPEPGRRAYRTWNAAVLADGKGQIAARYDKTHLVIFGEYVPFAEYLPGLYKLTPLTGGVTAGAGPVAMPSRGVVYAPNICYESVLPHVIRRQVAALRQAGTPPDVLVNLTNDAWYWGSSELDMHLACDVMRAIENRMPHLVAANGGISAHIDSCGRIIEQSPRQQTDYILADVTLDSRPSVYSRLGDWPAGICLALCAVWACAGRVQRTCRSRAETSDSTDSTDS